ncbi:MAG: hypothetical protein FJX72_15880 [Armatimonadetes bacterium]|nr:hypothetical protein [Armatimonadota bacterium]
MDDEDALRLPDSPDPGASSSVARINELVTELVTRSRPAPRSILRRLRAEPYDAVVVALANAAQRQTQWNLYARVVYMLARVGGSDALRKLETEATRMPAFSGQTVRALAMVGGDEADAVLLRLLASRRAALRRSVALVLARRRSVRAVAPLFSSARLKSGRPDPGIVVALRTMGRSARLIEMLFEDPTLDASARVHIIETIESMPRELGRVDARRVLNRLARTAPDANQGAIAEADKLYWDRKTLLRPSERLPDATLLRPASGVGPMSSDRLLRPADGEPDTAQPDRREGMLGGILRRLKEAFDGG